MTDVLCLVCYKLDSRPDFKENLSEGWDMLIAYAQYFYTYTCERRKHVIIY